MTISTLPATEPVEALHQTLRQFRTPARLGVSPWLASPLVVRKQQQQPTLTPVDALKAVLTDALEHLAGESPTLTDLLRGRFWEGRTVAEMLCAERPESQSERRFYEQQQLAIQRLAELLDAEARLCTAGHAEQRLLRRLPIPSYRRLFGMETCADRLYIYLCSPQHHPIVSVKGLGGIGKTALADHAVRKLLADEGRLHDLVWVSAKQQYLTPSGTWGTQTQICIEQIFDELGDRLGLGEVIRLPLARKVERLAGLLRAAPYLVVLDNLENVEDFRQLAPWLERLAGPTQFLLTARETVPALTAITQIDLHEMAQPAALELIQYMAEEKGVGGFDPQTVYNLVGGNPLAIILVVSQMQVLPPDQVLASIRLGSTADFYTYIYWQSWRALSEGAQRVLFTIQRAGDKADWSWLTMTGELDDSALAAALQSLLDLSLVQPQQDITGQRAYGIHRLTSTFLRTEVLGWK